MMGVPYIIDSSITYLSIKQLLFTLTLETNDVVSLIDEITQSDCLIRFLTF